MNVVFDLDGTLIDSAPDIQFVASAILDRLGKAGLSLAETRSFIGEGSAVFVSRMMAARDIADTGQSHAALYDEFISRYEHAVDRGAFYPGALAALMGLKADGHCLGLCTNKPERPARAVIRYMGLEGVFDAVIAGGMIDSRKPEPDMLLETIRGLGGGPTLYVGDSEIDAETAQRAKVPFALYSGGYRKVAVSEMRHDWVFDHFDMFPAIVAELEARLLDVGDE
ncbi:MAG: HAD-IA family hydrolase [Halieaceae bacterium]|jgi:phosphoglycolate phosphatase|nr:HAD-IA family hydrolase [Halieaceae bacterium]